MESFDWQPHSWGRGFLLLGSPGTGQEHERIVGEFDLWTSGHGDRQRPFYCCQILVITGKYLIVVYNSFWLSVSQSLICRILFLLQIIVNIISLPLDLNFADIYSNICSIEINILFSPIWIKSNRWLTPTYGA